MVTVDKMTKDKVRDEYRFPSQDQCVAQVEKVVSEMIKGMKEMMASIAHDTGQAAEDPEPYCVLVNDEKLYIGVFVADWNSSPIPDSIYRCGGALGQIW
jgi:hypothetical protein